MSTKAALSPAEAQAIWRDGGRALREGDAAAARAAFQRIVDAGQADGAVWLGVALAARRLGEQADLARAVDEVLARDPRDLRALMLKADLMRETGDPVAAATFYGAVVQLGGSDAARLPPDVAADVARAREAVAALSSAFETFLVAELRRHGLDTAGGRRVRESVDLMLGKTRIYQQEPTQYYFPGLPQIPFYERDALPWLDRVEAATDAIREELHGVLADDAAFRPYVEEAANRPAHNRGALYGDPSWSAFYLVKNGEPVAGNAERCPRTLEALAEVPLCAIPERTPQVLFSLLRPGARIPPHSGLLNARLICHLPLIVPEGCGFRVGNQIRPWVEGRAWAFDDSIEHEAWNESDALRVVLIFDVWRPELTALERELVSVIVQATKRVGRGPDG